MPQGPQHTGPEGGPVVEAEPLLGLARQLRLGLEVQNRKVGKRIHRCCFLGGEAVSFLTSRGITRSRAEGVAVCQRLLVSSLIERIDDESNTKTAAAATFTDNYTFYRFTCDKESEVAIRLNKEASWLYPASEPSRRWAFAPHTAHNSLVLDAALASELEESLGSEDPGERLASLVRLRERVKQVCKMSAPGWVKRGEAVDGRGVRVKSYRRTKPIGDFRSRKTVGVVPVSPRQFLLSFFDLREGRRCWEPSYAQGAVLEEIDVPEEEGSVMLATPRCLKRGRRDKGPGQSSMESPPMPGGERARDLWPAASQDGEREASLWESGTAEEGRTSRSSSYTLPVLGGPETDRTRSLSSLSSFPCVESPRVAGVSGEEGGDVLLNAAAAAGMSIARFDDPAHQQVIHHIAANLTDLDTSCCGACGKEVGTLDGGRSGLVMCMCCGILACVECCGKEVFDAAKRDIARVCDHCFRFSSRINHPKRVSIATEDGLPSWASELKAEDSHERPIDAAEEAGGVKQVRCVAWGDRVERTMDQHDAHCSRAYLQASPHTTNKPQPPSSGSTPEDYAALRIKVPQSFPPSSSAHTTASNSDSSDGRPILVHTHSTSIGGPPLTGLPEVEASTRIVHRTVTSPAPALVQPREACVLQDTFCDEEGTVYVYEISVQHMDATPSPKHVAAEVLFLCYSAKALPPAPPPPAGRPTSAASAHPSSSILTVISQVDAKSTLPTWMNRLAADRGRYGLFGGHDIYPQQPIPACPPAEEEEISRANSGASTAFEAGKGHVPPPTGMPMPTSSEAPKPQGMGARHFDLVSVIGRGGFGRVYLVRHKTNRRLFAMKVLKKSELRQRNQIERTRTERKVMAGLEHPFIVRLHYAFHTPARVYMVMDFCQGGDLFTLMRRIGCMDEQGARVLGAEMALALQHLHDRDIVYRDLKPENVLLGADGHVKLTDFGLCRYFEVRPPQSPAVEGAPLRAVASWEGEPDVYHSPLAKFVTHSFCGTEEYMAPEVLLNQGHGSAVDWWCLGLCLHEMMARRHPFKGGSHIDTLRNICAMDPCLESGLSDEAQQCMDQLLRKNPKARVHCLPMLQRQPLFQHLDWDDVYHKRLPPPFVPRLRGEEDTASFSALYTGDCIRDSEVTVAGRRGMGHESGASSSKKGESGGCFNFVPFALGLDGSHRGASKGFEDDEDMMFEGFDYVAPVEASARADARPCPRASQTHAASMGQSTPAKQAVHQVEL